MGIGQKLYVYIFGCVQNTGQGWPGYSQEIVYCCMFWLYTLRLFSSFCGCNDEHFGSVVVGSKEGQFCG